MRRKTIKNRKIILFFAFLFLLFGYLIYRYIAYPKIVVDTLLNDKIDIVNEDKTVNILILGIGGGTHDGPNLTDTIIFANINPEENKVRLISIPRDLWVPELQAKINTAYAFGQEKKDGGGITLTRSVVSKVVGQPIDYVVRIDFDGFVNAVDMLGGLDIDVDNTLDDYKYPIEGMEEDLCGALEEDVVKLATESSQYDAFPCRYEHLHFDTGTQHMDGKTALKYVRSRNAEGKEGSDFSRSKRQEKVIAAFKNKFFSVYTILNPVKLIGIIDVLRGSIDTDITQDEYDDFIKLSRKVKDADVVSTSLDFGDEESGREALLYNPPISADHKYQWVIIPVAGTNDFSQIHESIECFLDPTSCKTPSITPTIGASDE